MLHIGGTESQRFRGVLSLVQVWDHVRHITEIISVYNAKETSITRSSYIRGLTADWSWDSFLPGPGMKRTSPSTRGQRICPTGQHLNSDGVTCVDKLPGSIHTRILVMYTCILIYTCLVQCMQLYNTSIQNMYTCLYDIVY